MRALTRREAALGIASVAAAAMTGGRARAAGTVLHMGDQRGNVRALMDAAGLLADLPYRIDWSEFPAAAPLAEAMAAGAIDGGVIGDAPFTFAFASGAPIRAIATRRTSQEGTAIVVPAGSKIETADDLRGKRIATGRGSIGHFLVLALLDSKGWPADAVKLRFLLPSDAKAALTNGAVDAWSTWEPYTSQVETIDGGRRVVDGVGITPGQGYQAATVSAIADKRPALEDFIRRLTIARRWGDAHAAAYATTWAKLMNIPESVPHQWFTRTHERIVPADAEVYAGEQKVIDLYAKAGLLAKPFEASTAFDPSFNDAIRAGNGGT